MIELSLNVKVTEGRIRDLLVAALEGGSNYWISNIRYELRGDLTIDDFREGGKMQPEDYYHWCQLIPLTEGCRLIFDDDEDEKTHYLDRKKISRGLRVMSEKYLSHFTDFIYENDDASTGDVFLQCCVFGDIVYG